MSSYKKILLIADPSLKVTPAFERAFHLARESKADLHIAVFDHNSVIAGAALIDKPRADQARKAWLEYQTLSLREQAATMAPLDCDVSVEAVWGLPVEDQILRRVADWKPDIVIKDVELESFLLRVLFTRLDWQLLRECTVPLLLINSQSSAPPKRVLAAVDVGEGASGSGTPNSIIIHHAYSLAEKYGAEMHVIYAWVGPTAAADPMGAGLGIYGDLYELLAQQQRDSFDSLINKLNVPSDRAHFLIGPPAITVAEFAKDSHSDVLVIGSAHHRRFDRLLLGTTAESLLDRAPCNVLAVKS